MNDNETVEQAYEDIRKKIKRYKTDSAYEHIACMYTVFAVEDMIDRIEAAHQREVAELKSKMNDVVCENEALRDACGTCCAKREVAELRECLVRRSSHLNAILQTAFELRNGVPPELRKVMDECIVEEDKAVGLGVFSKKGAEDEGK